MRIRLLISMTVVSLLCACSFDTDNTPPQVTGNVPAADAADVSADTEIAVTFSEQLLGETLHAESLVVMVEGEPVSGTLSYDDVALSLIFTPDAPLTKTREYTVTLDPDMTDFARNRLGEYSFSFTVADGEWGEAFALSDGSSDASGPVIATAPDGTAIAAWVQSDGLYNTVYAAHYSPDFGWGFPGAIDIYALGDAGSSSPQISTGANGDTFVIWTEDDDGTANGGDGTGNYSVWAIRYTPDGGWEAPELLEDSLVDEDNAFQPRIAVDGEGNAIAVWAQWDDTVSPGRVDAWYNIFSTESLTWQGPELLETDDAGNAGSPSIAMNESGQAIAVWTQQNAADIISSYARRYVPGSGWQGAEEIDSDPDDTTHGGSPVAAVNGSGIAVVVWAQLDAGLAESRVESRFYTPGDGWSAPAAVSDTGEFSGSAQVKLDDQGRATALWANLETGSNLTDLVAARYEPGSGWSDPVSLEAQSGQSGFFSDLAVDNLGNALAVWLLIDGAITDVASGVDVDVLGSRYRASQASWSEPEPVESLDAQVGPPKVVIGPQLDGIAVWPQMDGSVVDIQVNHFQ